MSNISNLHSGHRQRIKDEFLENGLAHFTDHKILEMLLFYAIPRADTNELGHELINRFGSISGVLDAEYNMLIETPGIGKESALLIKFVSQIIARYMEDYSSLHNTITDAESAKKFMEYKFLTLQIESIFLACLSPAGKVIFCDRIAEGSPETVGIRPVDIIKIALRANSSKIVIAHNHPYGIATPSNADMRTTIILKEELGRVDIELFDHVIVAGGSSYSMRESGMLPS